MSNESCQIIDFNQTYEVETRISLNNINKFFDTINHKVENIFTLGDKEIRLLNQLEKLFRQLDIDEFNKYILDNISNSNLIKKTKLGSLYLLTLEDGDYNIEVINTPDTYIDRDDYKVVSTIIFNKKLYITYKV